MKRQWGIGVGSASVLIIFVLLCLTVFATLSLVSAQADLRLAERAAETTAAWYEADGRAAEFLCALDQAFENASSPAELPGAASPKFWRGPRFWTTASVTMARACCAIRLRWTKTARSRRRFLTPSRKADFPAGSKAGAPYRPGASPSKNP